MSPALAAARQPEPSDDLAADLEPLREESRAGKRNLRVVGPGDQATSGRGAEPRDARGAADLSRAQRTFELLRAQVARLEEATARRDFTDARALASSIRTTVPSLTSAIERARTHGADAAALAAVEKRAAELVPRLEAAMQRAPENARGLGFDLLDPSTEEKLEARWLAKLDGAAADPMARSAATAFGGARASSSSAPGRTVLPSHEAFEAAADHRIWALVKAGRPLAAPAYLHYNMRDLRVELGAFLATHLASTGHPQVAFPDGPGAFVTQLLAELRPADASACVTRLGQWLTPAELYAIADRNRAIFERPEQDVEINYERGPKGPATWSPAVASALGAALLDKLVATLPKMSQRLVALSMVEAASEAQDGSVDKDAAGAAGRAGAAPGLTVRDFGPMAPLEQQIARAFLGRRGTPSVTVSAAPAPTPALASPKTRAAASPRGNRSPQRAHRSGSAAASAAERAAPTTASVVRQWGAIDEDLKSLSFKLGFGAELVPAQIAHVQKRFDLESLAGRDLQMRATAFTEQQALLAAILVTAKPLLDNVEPPDARGPTPVRDSLRLLAKAAGHSHLPTTARRFLARAGHTQRDHAFTSLEALCGQIATRLELAHQLAETTRGRTRYSAHILGKSIQVRHEEALAELAAIRGAAVGAGTLDPRRLQALYARLDKLHFEASLISNAGAVGQMFQIFDELEDDRWVLFSEGIRSSGDHDVHFGEHGDSERGGDIGRMEAIRRGASTLRGALTTLHSRWLKVERQAQLLEQGGASEAAQRPATGLLARAAQATVERELSEIRRLLALIGGDAQVAAFLNQAHQTAKSVQRRALCVQIAAMIGVAIASSGVAAAATGVAAGLGAGAMTAQLAGVAAESVAFSALNARLNGDRFGAELLATFAGNLATFGAMSGAKALTQAKLAGALSSGGARALGAKLADFTATSLTAAAVQFAQAQVTQLAQRGRVLSEEELAQTLVQGLAMAIGSSVLSMTRSLERAKAGLARTLAARRQLKALARQVSQSGDPAQAMKLLNDFRAHVDAEQGAASTKANATEHAAAAKIPAPILTLTDWEIPNRVIGTRTFKARAGAEEILRQISAGNLEVIKQLGVDVPKDLKHKIQSGLEFGVGRLPNGEFVVVRGDRGEVEWGQLPGVTMEAHTHASVEGNDLFPNAEGNPWVSLREIQRAPQEPSIAREMILPSIEDVSTLAQNQIGSHRVFTPYVIKGDQIMKPPLDWQGGKRLEFVVNNAKATDYLAENGQRVYEAELVGQFGDQEVMRARIFAVPSSPLHSKGAGIFMTRPSNVKKAGAHGSE